MNTRRLLVPALVSAALFSVGFLVIVMIPGGGTTTEADFTAFYVERDSFFDIVALLLVLLAGVWALAWFFTELRHQVPDGALSRAAFSVSLLGLAGLALGAVVAFAPAGVQMNSEGSPFVGVPVAHALAQAGLGMMLTVGMYSLGLAVALFSLALRRAALVPGWFGIAGVVIAVLMLGSYFWAPGYLLPMWVVLLGVLRVEGQPPVAATGGPGVVPRRADAV